MNHKVYRLGFCLVLCGLLVGCGSGLKCRHQWSEADCINASSCTRCGEVYTEALGHDWTAGSCETPEVCSRCGEAKAEIPGHDWVEATCESPETCGRCGETRGDTLPHRYGKWTLDGEDMHRVCSDCQTGESQGINYALYLREEIAGHWNLCYTLRGGRIFYANNSTGTRPDTEIIFQADGSIFTGGCELKDSGNVWVYDRAEYNQETGQHTIYIRTGKTEEDAVSESCFSCMENSILYTTTDNNGDVVVLAKDQGEVVAPVLAGDWAAFSVDTVYNIHFSEDRRFTANFDGEVSGFWQPRPLESTGGSFYSAELLLNYGKDGEEKTCRATLSGLSMEQSQYTSPSLMAEINDDWVVFNPGLGETLTEMAKKADTAPLGDWTSVDYIVSYPGELVDGEYVPGEEVRGLSTEYGITFWEDGTFSATLHEEFDGTWTLRRITDDGHQVSWSYSISAPGLKDASYFEVSSEGNGYLYIYNGSESMNYRFRQMNPEEQAARNQRNEKAPTMVVGKWFDALHSGAEIIFNEDGTFLLNLGESEPYEGLWHFRAMSEGDENTFYYICDIETEYETFYKTLYGEEYDIAALIEELPKDPESGEIEKYREESAVILTDKGGVCSLELTSYLGSFHMVDAEGVAAAREAASQILGHWRTDAISKYDKATQQSTEIQGDFYLDISEDGSLTGYIDREVQGSWSYLDSENGARRYLLSFHGNDLSSLFTLKDGCLSGPCMSYIVELRK